MQLTERLIMFTLWMFTCVPVYELFKWKLIIIERGSGSIARVASVKKRGIDNSAKRCGRDEVTFSKDL